MPGAAPGQTLSPSADGVSPGTPSAQKRKRSITDDEPRVNGVPNHQPATPDPASAAALFKKRLSEILAVLRKHDTLPSILDHPLQASDASTSPPTKRVRLSQTGSPITVASCLNGGTYASFRSLIDDVEAVAAEILLPVKEKDGSHLTTQETQLCARVPAFQNILKGMIGRDCDERSNGVVRIVEQNEIGQKEMPREIPKATAKHSPTVKSEFEDISQLNEGRTVLSVYANAHGTPKQLFTSFQKPVKNDPAGGALSGKASTDESDLLDEHALPNFILQTKIAPVPTYESKPKIPAPTIEECFPVPPLLLKPHNILQPPKPYSGNLVTKSSVLGFVPRESIRKPHSVQSNFSWFRQKLSVASWVSYGAEVVQEPTSPDAWRKNRTRALSMGESRPALSEDERLAREEAEQDALFQRVFSTFAPTYDDSDAIVPHWTKDEAWWNKVGQYRCQAPVPVDPALLGESEDDPEPMDLDEEEQEFKRVVEEFEPESDPAFPKQKPDEEKDVEEILQEVSGLIETLYSLQRIRMSTLHPQNVMTSGKTPLLEMIGSPTSPSSTEIETYNTLKAMLKTLILQLPPYAVARLNGDKLSALNLSGQIVVQTSDDPGVMDDASLHFKPTPLMPHAQPHQSMTSRPSTSSSPFPPHPGSSNQFSRPPAQTPLRQSQPSYFPQSTPQPRTTALPYQRASGGVQTFAGGYPTTGGAGGHRTSFSSAPQPFGQGSPRANSSFHHPQSAQYYGASSTSKPPPPSYGGSGNTYFPNTPTAQQSAQRNFAPPPPQGPRIQAAAAAAPAAPLPQHFATPLQPAPTPQGQGQGQAGSSVPRQGFGGGSSVPTPLGNNSTPSTGGAARTAYQAGGNQNPLGPSGFHSTMSNVEQQQMMDRQRAQVNAQRVAAQGQGQV